MFGHMCAGEDGVLNDEKYLRWTTVSIGQHIPFKMPPPLAAFPTSFCFTVRVSANYKCSYALDLFNMQTPLEGVRKTNLSYYSVNYFIGLFSCQHIVDIKWPFRLEGYEGKNEGKPVS